jgi:DNA helicase-2/ATP-dependent DNA helicase PcrA
MTASTDLNPRQREAVDHGAGAVLILAGAGSGKTRALVHRIARLIDRRLAEPWEILAVTFTNKAARELVERCTQMVGPAAADLWAGTFHGIGARLLRRHGELLGYPAAFTIFDADDQMRLAKELVAEADLDETLFAPEAVRAYLEAAKHEAHLPDSPALPRHDLFTAKAAELYAAYQRRLKRLGAMDFGDLIVNVVELFRRHPDVLGRYQRRFRHVLVDEYQDTNHAQYLMVSLLAAGHGNLCVVGDDDQSIYGWRGASLRNILEFERDFPGARVIHLDQNYRSTGNIIEAAQAVIANNRLRMGKRIWTESPPGEPVRIYTASDERDEARYIGDAVTALGRRRGDAAVFYRTNAQSRAIEEELIRRGIPYVIVGATRFYERREIKDLIAYLRFVQNPNDDLSLARIINVPARGIGRVTWDRLRAAAEANASSTWQAIASDDAAGVLSGAARQRVDRFRRVAAGWLRDADAATVTPLLERVIGDAGYVEFLENLPGDDGRARVENVHELLTVSQSFDAQYADRRIDEDDRDLGALATFLEQLALVSDIDGYAQQGGAVTLMTLHNSKGLEFPHVFIAGMEEGIFPHARSTGDDERGMEEERRLCYVGITRARRELTLLHAVKRHVFGTQQFNFPSRFLEEIPSSVTSAERREPVDADTISEWHTGDDTEWWRSEAGGRPADPVPSSMRRSRASAGSEDTECEDDASIYRVGMRVVHPMFGVGTVRKCDHSGKDEKLVVHFQRVGIKKLVARYARLEIA